MARKFKGTIAQLQEKLAPFKMQCELNKGNIAAVFKTDGLNINFYHTGTILVQGSDDFLKKKAISVIFGEPEKSISIPNVQFDYSPVMEEDLVYDCEDVFSQSFKTPDSNSSQEQLKRALSKVDDQLKDELLTALSNFVREIVRDELAKRSI